MNGLVSLRAARFLGLLTTLSLFLAFLTGPFEASEASDAAVSIKIAIVYDVGGRGDHGINDSAARGVDAIKKKFGLTALSVRELVTNGSESDRESRLQFLASANYNLVIAVGASFSQAMGVVAVANPNTDFSLINDASVGNLNLSDMVFSNQDGAYLAGVLAASATKSKRVGIVAPSSYAPYLDDFKSGVVSILPKAIVLSQFVDKEVGNASRVLAAQGVDIIFSEWMSSSEVEDTVAALYTKAHPIHLIGVNPDQYFLLGKNSQKILIGAVSKHVDSAVKDVMSAALNGATIIDVLDAKIGIFGHMYTVKDGGESMALTALGAPYSIKVAAAIAKLKSGKVKAP